MKLLLFYTSLLVEFIAGIVSHDTTLQLIETLNKYWQIEHLLVVMPEEMLSVGDNGFRIDVLDMASYKKNVSFISLRRFRHENINNNAIVLSLPAEKIHWLLQKMFVSGTSSLSERCSIIIPVTDVSQAEELTRGIYFPLHRQVFALQANHQLFELYHLAPFRASTKLGSPWTAAVPRGLVIPMPEAILFRRRADLQGIQLKACTREDPPDVIISSWKPFVAEGYFPELWRELEYTLNFSTEYEKSSATSWGRSGVFGQWTGLVGKLQRGEADVAVAGMTMTTARMNIVDFTTVLVRNSYQVYFREDSALFSVYTLSFFSPWIILTVLCVTVAASSATHLLISRLRPSGRPLSPVTVIFYNLSAFCQQGTSWESIPRSLSGRLTLWLTYCAGLLVFNIFSATVMSRLAVYINKVPFSSLSELAASGSYTLGGRKGTADADILQSGPLERRYWLSESSFPASNTDGLKRACREQLAFLTPYKTNFLITPGHSPPCHLNQVTLQNIHDHLTVAVAKGLPHRHLFNFYLRKMQESGLLDHLHRKWYSTPPPLPPPPVTIDTRRIAPIIAWISLGVVLSTCVLLIERWIHRRKMRASLYANQH